MSRWLDGFDCGKFTIAVNNGLGTLLANQTEGDGEQLVKVPAIIVQLGKGLAVLAALFKELGFESWGVNGLNLLGIKVREEVPVSVSVVDRDWNQKALFKFAAFLIAPFKRFLGDIRFGPSEFHLIGSFLNGLLFNFTNIIAQSARIVKPFVKFKVGRVQPYIIPSYPKSGLR